MTDELSATKYVRLLTTGGLTEFEITSTLPAGTGFSGAVVLRGQDNRYNYTLGVTSIFELTVTQSLFTP